MLKGQALLPMTGRAASPVRLGRESSVGDASTNDAASQAITPIARLAMGGED
jgi:hypothetical protein